MISPATDGLHTSFCRLCEALCGLEVEVRNGEITRIGPDRAHVVSEGHMCVKGARMVDVVNDPDRVLTPLRRSGAPGEFSPVSWDEALDHIAARLQTVIARTGGNSVASYLGNPGSFATMHPAYLTGFMASLGSRRKFNALHTDTAAKNLALELTYGNPYRFTFPDLEDCDFLIIIGANPAVSHMSLVSEPRAMQKLDAIAARGGVVVVDPRRTETARRYEHLPVRPDSDVWLVTLLLQTIFAEGLHDQAALERTTTGWRELRSALDAVDSEVAAAACNVPLDQARNLARRFAGARTAACYTRLGTGRGRYPTLTNLLIEALNIVTGRFGQRGGWVIGQGPIDLMSHNTNPYGSMHSRLGNLPLIMGTAPGGSLANEILTPGDGQIRALFVDSGNPVLSYPRGDRLAEALEQLELMVSLDLYMNETNRHAHYILPAATFLERADLNELWGANAPRPWIQYSDPVIPPRGEARLEFDVYAAIARRMGLPSPLAHFATPACPEPDPIEAAAVLLRTGKWGAAAGEDKLTIERLRGEFPHGMRFRDSVDAAGSHAFVTHADGRLRLWGPLQAGELNRLLTDKAATGEQMRLFGRRRLQALNSWMHNSERLSRGDQPTLQIHPDDAARLNIADGAMVRVTSSAGSLSLVAEVTDQVIPGSASYPHGYGHEGGWQRANGIAGANINLLASDCIADWEQVSGICLLDGIPIRIETA
jgi:formate dehydrogenase